MASRNPENYPNSSDHVLGKIHRGSPLREAFVTTTYNPRKDLLMAKNIKPALDAINIDSKYIGIYTDMGKESRRNKNPIR